MAANIALQPIDDQGWHTGLSNLLRKELHDWWGTPKGWMQILLWLVILNGMLALVFFNPGAGAETAAEDIPGGPGGIFPIFTGIFAPMGVIVLAQSRIIGEKQSGTAAWLLSKPLSRSAFLLSKLLADGIGMLVTMLGVQGVVAYAQFSAFTGDAFPVLPFLGALGLLGLNHLFYLVVTLMLGAFFSGRNAVIGGGLILLLVQTQLGKGALGAIMPGALPFMAIELLAGTPLPSMLPIIMAVVLMLVCMAMGLWRFEREEL